MPDLQEKQFDLGGFVFGADSGGVEITGDGFQPGEADMRDQDAELVGADGVRFGKDYRGGMTWAFSGYTNGEDEADGWRIYAAFKRAWDAREVRTTSRAVVALRYRVADKIRRVYGRPRRLTPVINNLSLNGRIDIEADFKVAYPYYFDDVEHSQTFGIGAPLELDAGIPVPFIPPFVSSAGSTPRSMEINIGGDVETPLVITITGPVDGPLVAVDGRFSAKVEGPVEQGNPVTFDARPWVRSVTTASGGSVPISPRVTKLAKMWLPPGRYQIIFSGDDITSTATVRVSWRDAYSSPR